MKKVEQEGRVAVFISSDKKTLARQHLSKDSKEVKERSMHLIGDEHLRQREGECNSPEAGIWSIPGPQWRRTEATVARVEWVKGLGRRWSQRSRRLGEVGGEGPGFIEPVNRAPVWEFTGAPWISESCPAFQSRYYWAWIKEMAVSSGWTQPLPI